MSRHEINGKRAMIPSISRQQMLVWGIVGLVILLIGANYLRSNISSSTEEDTAMATVEIKESSSTASSRLKIHVIGEVLRPGLYEAEPGGRVADALALAGGPTAAADLNQINLAAKLADGQQLLVPQKGAAGVVQTAPGEGGSSAAAGSRQPLNLNSATEAQLEELDGVGPKTAQKIVEYRTNAGGFKSIEELMEVPGIGPAKFDQLKGQVTI